MKILFQCIVLGGAAALVACASQAPVRKPSVATTATDAMPLVVPEGYDRVVSNGQVLYCHTETITGSRMPKDFCVTPAQLRDQQDRSRTTVEQIQSAGTRAGCVPSPTSLECR